FFYNVTSTTYFYTLSLHDALPICDSQGPFSFISPRDHAFPLSERFHVLDDRVFLSGRQIGTPQVAAVGSGLRCRIELVEVASVLDRKSTRLNSSHLGISYAVFCLK